MGNGCGREDVISDSSGRGGGCAVLKGMDCCGSPCCCGMLLRRGGEINACLLVSSACSSVTTSLLASSASSSSKESVEACVLECVLVFKCTNNCKQMVSHATPLKCTNNCKQMVSHATPFFFQGSPSPPASLAPSLKWCSLEPKSS